MENFKFDPSDKDLMESFYHFDKIHSNKENLFIPLAFAIIPLILFNWHKIPICVVIIAAITSLFIYLYHLLVCLRFKRIQNKIFDKFHNKEFVDEIIKEKNIFFRIIWLRSFLGILLLIIWIVLIYVKCTSHPFNHCLIY